MRLFISYAHDDEAQVEQLVDILREGGHDPWFDDHLMPGQDWKARLNREIEAADAFVYTLTSHSVKSEWCRWELARAVELGKPVIPVLLVEGTAIPNALGHYQYADFSEGATPESVARLMGGLMQVAVRIPRKEAPRAPRNPRGVPARATQEAIIFQRRKRLLRRMLMTAGLLVVVAIVFAFVSRQLPDPVAAAGYIQQGNARFNEGDLQGALDSFSRAVAADPQNAEAYTRRGWLQLAVGRPDAAIADFTAAVDIDPARAEAYRGRGIGHVALDDRPNAAHDFWQWMSLNQRQVIEEDEITPGDTVSVEMQQGSIYRIPFEAAAGDIITVRAEDADESGVDPLLILLGPNEDFLSGDDDGGGNLDALIEDFEIPEDGTYTLVVGHAGGGSEGAVDVYLDLRTE
jgi:tetratricopeptide (TPR) repeat protein